MFAFRNLQWRSRAKQARRRIQKERWRQRDAQREDRKERPNVKANERTRAKDSE